MSVICFVEAVLFVLFTGCMGADQFEAISKNTPYIDRLQNKRGKQRSLYVNLKDVFGGGFGIGWFIPMMPTASIRAEFDRMCYDTMATVQDSHDQLTGQTTKENNQDVDESKTRNAQSLSDSDTAYVSTSTGAEKGSVKLGGGVEKEGSKPETKKLLKSE